MGDGSRRGLSGEGNSVHVAVQAGSIPAACYVFFTNV